MVNVGCPILKANNAKITLESQKTYVLLITEKDKALRNDKATHNQVRPKSFTPGSVDVWLPKFKIYSTYVS